MPFSLFPFLFGVEKKGKTSSRLHEVTRRYWVACFILYEELTHMREKPTTTTTSGHLYPRRPERSAHTHHWIFWALSSYMSCKNMPHTDSQNKITILFSLQFQVANLNVVTWAESDAVRCEFTILHMAGVICRVWHECVGLFFSAACVKDFC